MSELSKFSLSDTSLLTLRLPDGSKSDIQIELYNQHTRQYQKARSETLRATVEQLQGGELSDEQVTDQVNRLLARMTKSWKNLEWEGKKLKCTEKNAFEIYSNPGLAWLRDQVDEFVHEAGNFLGNSQAG